MSIRVCYKPPVNGTMLASHSFLPSRLASLRARLTWLFGKLAREWRTTLLWVGVASAAVYVIAYPFFLVTYPPITDLPLHATDTSILRHYFDRAYRFHDQFELHFFETPYATQYFLGAWFALFFPIAWATKLAAMVMLTSLPAGLAVLFHAMKKSPLWGLLGLGAVWCSLTHWGFFNHMAALGLFAMSAGFTLLIVDRPTRGRQLALFATLALLFFTHVFRFPFAIATVIGIPLLMYPATRRWKQVLAPLLGALVLFGSWMLAKRPGMSGSVGPLSIHRERFAEIPEYLFASFVGPDESLASTQMLWLIGGLFVLSSLLFFLQGRHRGRSFRELWWGAGVTLIPLFMGGACLLGYLMLPMSIGLWWYVYPREITAAGFVALAAIPDLPRQWWLRLPLLAAVAVMTGRLALITAENWDRFEETNADFRAIMTHIPSAPKLMYLIFDHSGSTRRVTPFTHMPAWVQAEKGGWLSFHPAAWADLHPIRYRPGADIPPPVPERWEWTPERFDLQRNGAYFDTFLVRSAQSPDYLFAADTTIHPVSHIGRWWLYRRDGQR